MTSPTDLRVAVIGAGPAGIYASDLLAKQGVNIDLFEQMPAPFGLIRYGVAPDHPRIKGIIASLHRVLDTPPFAYWETFTLGKTSRSHSSTNIMMPCCLPPVLLPTATSTSPAKTSTDPTAQPTS